MPSSLKPKAKDYPNISEYCKALEEYIKKLEKEINILVKDYEDCQYYGW